LGRYEVKNRLAIPRSGRLATCLLAAFSLMLGVMVQTGMASDSSPSGFDPSWNYQMPIRIDDPAGVSLTDYQVHVQLDSSFNFSKARSDGGDLRFTDASGTELIPFWIESWNPPTSASIWVKVPSIPTEGTTIYLYYGNPSAQFEPPETQTVPAPPLGPWTNVASSNFGLPGGLLAENMVRDADGTYWQVFSDRRTCNAQIVFAKNTTGDAAKPTGWELLPVVKIDFSVRSTHPRFTGDSRLNTDPGNLLNPYLDAPSVVRGDDGRWYLFYNWITAGSTCGIKRSGTAYRPIGVARADSVLGPYVELDPFVLQHSAIEYAECAPGLKTCGTRAWEWARVTEPYIFSDDIDGDSNPEWVMLYMGDRGNYDNQNDLKGKYFIEQVSYAVAESVTGPYVKWNDGLTPWIAFGRTGSVDAGTIADPHAVRIGDTWVIFYAASPTTSDWKTSWAMTQNWETFTKSGTYLRTKDDNSPFRGAVSRFGDTYYFPYVGSSASNSGPFQIATQPATTTVVVGSGMNDPNAVFDFYDGFEGTMPDLTKWQLPGEGYGGTMTVAKGNLTMCGAGDLSLLTAKSYFGLGYVLESRSRHTNAGASDSTIAAAVGFGRDESRSAWDEPFPFKALRMLDLIGQSNFVVDADNADHDEFSDSIESGDPPGDYVNAGVTRDTAWHVHRIARVDASTATFQFDDSIPITLTDTMGRSAEGDRVTSDPLAPWFFTVRDSCLDTDWIRVRKYAAQEPVITMLEQKSLNTAPVVEDQSVSTNENEAVTITLTAEDAESDPLSYLITSAPSDGALYDGTATNGNALGSGDEVTDAIHRVTYVPAVSYNGVDSFAFRVNDGDLDSSAAIVSIDVTPVNSAPIATDGIVWTDVDVAVSADLTALVTDVETADADLTYAIVSAPAHGTLGPAMPGVFDYTPDTGYTGPDSFTFNVTDRGDPDNCGVVSPSCDAALTSETRTVSIDVGLVNDAPNVTKGGTDEQTVQYSDAVATMTVAASDVDSAVDSLVASSQWKLSTDAAYTVGLPIGLSLTLSSKTQTERTWEITGAPMVPTGTYLIQVVVADGSDAADPVTFTLEVARENAQILYNGEWLAQLGSTSLPMQATVLDSAAAGYAGTSSETGAGATIGDITKMKVAFDVFGPTCSGTPQTVVTSVTEGSALGDGIGTATASLLNPGGTNDVTYCVVARIVGDSAADRNLYYTADYAQTAAVTFYLNSGQLAAGGGWIIDPDGSNGNFGFNARNTKKGSPKGQVVYVYRGSYGGVLADFVIKSNVITKLTFQVTSFPMSATLQGNSSIHVISVSDGAQLYGNSNATFSATVTDSGASSGIGSDSFTLTVYDENGALYKALPSNPAVTLSGGNVVIRKS
jgi:hypothetical protein